MKKLTAGIFATLLAVVSADGAYAAIASQGYVDDKVEAVETTVAGKADSTTVTALDTRVKTAEGEIDALQSEVAGKQDALGFTPENAANKTQTVNAQSTETQYPSAKAVWTAVSSVDANASVEALEGRVGKLETASATHATKTELTQGLAAKANTADLGDLATLDVVGSAQITDGAVATADIANKAVTKAKLADDIVTSLGKADSALQKNTADATYAVKALEGQVGTVSKENMGTTTATTVVGGVKEAIDAAKAADTKAANAASAASTAQEAAEAAQADVDALETTVSGQGTRLTAAEGEIDTIQGQISSMATSDTVTKLTERVTTAEGDITALETAVNDAESGLVATNAIADEALANAATAQKAAEAAQTTADAKQDKLTGTIGGLMQPVYLNNGTITAGTALGSLATKSKVTNTEVDDGALAQSKISGLATSLAAKLTTPPTSAKGEDGLYVLTYNGTDFQWEDIARTVAD